jgi:hypothetical protein
VIIEVFVARRQSVNALTQQVDLAMGDQFRRARIDHRLGERAALALKRFASARLRHTLCL